METATKGDCLRQQQPLVDERRRSFIKKVLFLKKYGSLSGGSKVKAGGIPTCFVHPLPETHFSFLKLGGKNLSFTFEKDPGSITASRLR